MDRKAMYKLSYGLFVLTAREDEKDNGCIINTAIQAASEPNQLSILSLIHIYKLILSPGAKPTQPRLPGVGIDKLFTLRTVEDTFRIKEYINKNHPKSAVLAGGGFKMCIRDRRYWI